MSFKEYLTEGKEGIDYSTMRETLPIFMNIYAREKGDLEETFAQILNVIRNPEDYSLLQPKSKPKSEKDLRKASDKRKKELKTMGDSSGTVDIEQFKKYISKVVPYLSKKIGGRQLVFSGNEKIEVSPEWIAYAKDGDRKARTKTAGKTTFHTLDDKYKINSSKLGGSSSFGGTQPEVNAMLLALADKYFVDDTEIDVLIDNINDLLPRIVYKVSDNIKTIKDLAPKVMDEIEAQGIQLPQGEVGTPEYSEALKKALSVFDYDAISDVNLREKIKKTFDDDISEFVEVREVDTIHSMLSEELSKLLSNNPKFKTMIINESLSGNIKFGKDSMGSANLLMHTHGETGESDIKIINEKLCSALAPFYTTKVAFDTNKKKDEDGKRDAYSSFDINKPFSKEVEAEVAVATNKFVKPDEDEKFGLLTQSHQRTFYDDIEELTESFILEEGFFDAITAGTKYITDKLTSIYKAIMEKIKTVAKEGFDALLAYFNISVESFNMEVKITDDQLIHVLKSV